MNKIIKVISIFVTIVILMSISFPVINQAVDLPIMNREEERTLDVDLRRDGSTVYITATDGQYNITELKYVHQYIETSNIDYFETDNNDIYTFDITPAQTIEETFELDGYGSYTVYAKNERGDRFLARLTINDPSDMPQITLTKSEDNPLDLTIQVTSKDNIITKLKIAKIQSIDEQVDFTTQGTDIQITQSNNVTVEYTDITEEGLYLIYAEDDQGNRTTSRIYLAHQNTPIYVEITDGDNPREVNLHITDTICNIVKVKVAKRDEIVNFDDFETKGEELEITEGQDLNLTYQAPEDNTYLFYIEDEAGYRKMVEQRITSEEKSMQIVIEQDENAPDDLIITATNTICDIVQMKILIGDNIAIKDFENGGEEIDIETGREVTTNYRIDENCTINVYIKDEQGYTYMYTKTIIGIDEPQPEPNEPPEITLVQSTDNPKQIDVTVQDIDSYIDQIKWAKGSQTVDYFATNGTRIGQGKLGSRINTEFTIDEIGTYTVYAIDEDGNKTIETITITEIVTPEPEPEPDPVPTPEPDDNITSSKYEIDTDTNQIYRIVPDTNVSTFRSQISTEVGYKIVNTSGEELQDIDFVGTRCKLITDTNKEYTLIVTGDLNGDGRTTLTDLSRLRKYDLGIVTIQPEYEKASDINNDGRISLTDISRLRKVQLGLVEL